MYALLLIGHEGDFPRSTLEESLLDRDGRALGKVLRFSTVAEAYPSLRYERPLVALVHAGSAAEDVPGLPVLKERFPGLRILVVAPPEARILAGRALARGADAYLLEPYFLEELRHLVGRTFRYALESMERLHQTRMEVLARFIQGLSHEINNRLTPIRLGLQQLMGGTERPLDEEEIRAICAQMHQEELRLADAVRELDAFASPQKAKRNAVPLHEVITEAIRVARSRMAHPVPVEDDFRAHLETVVVDRRKLVAAIEAILRFLAARADPRKAAITVTTETPTDTRLEISLRGRHTTPLGEQAEWIFVPLYPSTFVPETPRPGLAAAYGAVAAHEGTLDVEAAPEGAAFLMVLPLPSLKADGI